MTNTNKKIVIIAPDPLLTAFRILIQSAPTLDLLAAGVSLSAVCKKTQKKPDIVLVHLEKKHLPEGSDAVSPSNIDGLKGAWPGVYIIAIVNDPQQRKEFRKSDADKVLLEGVTPARLLLVIDEIETDKK